MNKTLFFTLIFACSMLSLTANGAPSKKGEATLPPMFLLGTNNNMMQMVYWCNLKEPQPDEDFADEFDAWHQEWALQDLFRHNASKYTKLIVDNTKTLDVKYVDEILLNPDGEEIYTAELHGRPEIPSAGARYAIPSHPKLNGDDLPGTIIVTDDYLATHKPLTIKPIEVGEDESEKLLPPAVLTPMEEKYGMTVSDATQSCIIGDRYLYGVLQFDGVYRNAKTKRDPGQLSSLALEIIVDGDKIYDFPVEGYYDLDFGPTWNADDGGTYFPGDIMAAFEGPQGLELCYMHRAPESATTGIMTINNGELKLQRFGVYHVLFDENMPVWKKDIEEMKKLYVAEDPGENESVKLTKWAHVFIDYDGEQIWISDEAEENGAFFNRKDGKFELIGTVRGNFKPSFPESRNGNHYLVISGPAGGPSYYTEIFKLSNGKVVERFNGLEVYGELDDCALNGKQISAEQGKAYMKAVPEAIEPYIFWTEINDK